MRIPFLIAALCVALVINAQTVTTEEQTQIAKSTQRVRPIEFEMRVGAAVPLDGIPYGNKSNGPVLGLELRYNFKNSPIDVGFVIDFTTAFYEFRNEPEMLEQDNRTTMIGFTADYNFRQGGKVNPFVGIGFGVGMHSALIEVVDDTNDCSDTALITTRMGVELWRHLRLMLAANLSCKYYSNVSLTVGYVIGGGKKK